MCSSLRVPSRWMRYKVTDLLYEGSRQDILTNRLVLVAPINSSLSMTDVGMLAQDSIRRIAIGEPSSVPAGIYGREALTHLGVWDTVEPKLIPSTDVRSTLAYVESGEVDMSGLSIKRTQRSVGRSGLSINFPIRVIPRLCIRQRCSETPGIRLSLRRSWTTYKPPKLQQSLKNTVSLW